MMARHSGLQLQVLALFKTALRVAKQKDQALLKEGAEAVTQSYRSGGTYRFVRERFRDDAFSVDRMNFAVIEHLLRKGQRDLKMLEQMKTASFANVPR
ncbi:hypothetical protein Poli38472_013611 [Pythium oligandrum]|uniref:Uncharacterized protein n=1 Tax=Pythium oligandrum TaxID=41045 RepID=A0A8K1CEM6_PYTOL|nr:hypothetical protein Poli38472_013611 [Pythium oligandrum]|eukprot:TMW61148.1 hypothetical protein Poli38472_013611 [Pythium oligandrum]